MAIVSHAPPQDYSQRDIQALANNGCNSSFDLSGKVASLQDPTESVQKSNDQEIVLTTRHSLLTTTPSRSIFKPTGPVCLEPKRGLAEAIALAIEYAKDKKEKEEQRRQRIVCVTEQLMTRGARISKDPQHQGQSQEGEEDIGESLTFTNALGRNWVVLALAVVVCGASVAARQRRGGV